MGQKEGPTRALSRDWRSLACCSAHMRRSFSITLCWASTRLCSCFSFHRSCQSGRERCHSVKVLISQSGRERCHSVKVLISQSGRERCHSVKVLISQSVSSELSPSFLDLKHKNATRFHYTVYIHLPMQTSLRIGNKCPWCIHQYLLHGQQYESDWLTHYYVSVSDLHCQVFGQQKTDRMSPRC